MKIFTDISLVKISVSRFIDKGAFSYSFEREAEQGNNEGFKFFGKNIEVKKLEIYLLKSIRIK